MGILVEDNAARRRFEILVDGSLAGYAAYEPHQDTIVFIHTQVDPSHRDMGVGSALVRAALDQVRQRGDRVVVHCPFIAAYLDRHPEYTDLLGSR